MLTDSFSPKHYVVSLSGGMDSSTLLLRCISEARKTGGVVTAMSFFYGQKHSVELERAKALVSYIRDNNIALDYEVIELSGLPKLLNSALVQGGAEVPEGHYAQENMKETVVPNRNKIFASLIQAVALSLANKTRENVSIALGIHAGDHAIYPDCRQEFRDIDYQAFVAGNWGAEKVQYYTPYLEDDKFGILKDGEKCCETLGLDFDEVYRRTNTSYKPMIHLVFDTYGNPSPEWFSDYKSASSVERVEAFLKLGRRDPVNYADEFGIVTWEYVKEYVSSVLDDHAKTV